MNALPRTTLPRVVVLCGLLMGTVNGRVVYLCGHHDDNDDQHGDSDDDDDDGENDDPGDAVTTVSGSMCSSATVSQHSHSPTQSPGTTAGFLTSSVASSPPRSSISSATSVPQTDRANGRSHSLSQGQIVGIIFAVCAALALLGLLYLWKRNVGRRSEKQQVDLAAVPPGQGSLHPNLMAKASIFPTPLLTQRFRNEGTALANEDGSSDEHLPLFPPAEGERTLGDAPARVDDASSAPLDSEYLNVMRQRPIHRRGPSILSTTTLPNPYPNSEIHHAPWSGRELSFPNTPILALASPAIATAAASSNAATVLGQHSLPTSDLSTAKDLSPTAGSPQLYPAMVSVQRDLKLQFRQSGSAGVPRLDPFPASPVPPHGSQGQEAGPSAFNNRRTRPPSNRSSASSALHSEMTAFQAHLKEEMREGNISRDTIDPPPSYQAM